MPAPRDRVGGQPSIRSPSSTISPAIGLISPLTARSKVVLPWPFGPDHDRSPAGLGTLSDSPRTTTVSP